MMNMLGQCLCLSTSRSIGGRLDEKVEQLERKGVLDGLSLRDGFYVVVDKRKETADRFPHDNGLTGACTQRLRLYTRHGKTPLRSLSDIRYK